MKQSQVDDVPGTMSVALIGVQRSRVGVSVYVSLAVHRVFSMYLTCSVGQQHTVAIARLQAAVTQI